MILVKSVIIIISVFLVSIIKFGDADAQGQDIISNDTSALMEKGIASSELRTI